METGTPSPKPLKVGIVALIAWVLSLVSICVLFFIVFMPYVTNSDSSLPSWLQSTLSSIATGGSCLLPLLALVLALIDILQKGTRKTFAIITITGIGITFVLCLLPLAAWAILIMMV